MAENTDAEPPKEEEPMNYSYWRLYNIEQPQIDQNPPPLPAGIVKKHVVWSSDLPQTETGFKYNGQTSTVVHSKPIDYPENNQRFRLADLVVACHDAVSAREIYASKLSQSNERRQECLQVVGRMMPGLAELPNILVAFGRGSIFDSARVPDRNADIDLILFTDKPFKGDEDLSDLYAALSRLASHNTDVGHTRTLFFPTQGGFESGSGLGFAPTPPSGRRVSWDIIHVPFDTLLSSGHVPQLEAYDRYALRTGKTLVDKTNGDFEKVRKIIVG